MTVRVSGPAVSWQPAKRADSQDDSGLIDAALDGDADVVASLLATGASPSCYSTSSYGLSPLVAAATSGYQGETHPRTWKRLGAASAALKGIPHPLD